jgi:hypothetical protein
LPLGVDAVLTLGNARLPGETDGTVMEGNVIEGTLSPLAGVDVEAGDDPSDGNVSEGKLNPLTGVDVDAGGVGSAGS